ncbi:TPA: head-tail adaptor protein, partial [Streptococcus suis]|nr:head-tail adaptor protein [Streptococcus suis]
FTLRYEKAILGLHSLTTHIQFRGQTYEIESIDGDTVPRQLIYIVAIRENSYD